MPGGGELTQELEPRSKWTFTIEGLANPWVPIIVWLEHKNPTRKPRDVTKGITASIALMWRVSDVDPALDKWMQTVVVVNETYDVQLVSVHFAAGDGTEGALKAVDGKAYPLD